jgi:outer membrane protein TolC
VQWRRTIDIADYDARFERLAASGKDVHGEADLIEQQLLNRYRAGQVSYSDVVTAQASALSARRTLVQLVNSRQASAIALIQALGGGWHASDGPSIETP